MKIYLITDINQILFRYLTISCFSKPWQMFMCLIAPFVKLMNVLILVSSLKALIYICISYNDDCQNLKDFIWVFDMK